MWREYLDQDSDSVSDRRPEHSKRLSVNWLIGSSVIKPCLITEEPLSHFIYRLCCCVFQSSLQFEASGPNQTTDAFWVIVSYHLLTAVEPLRFRNQPPQCQEPTWKPSLRSRVQGLQVLSGFQANDTSDLNVPLQIQLIPFMWSNLWPWEIIGFGAVNKAGHALDFSLSQT